MPKTPEIKRNRNRNKNKSRNTRKDENSSNAANPIDRRIPHVFGGSNRGVLESRSIAVKPVGKNSIQINTGHAKLQSDNHKPISQTATSTNKLNLLASMIIDQNNQTSQATAMQPVEDNTTTIALPVSKEIKMSPPKFRWQDKPKKGPQNILLAETQEEFEKAHNALFPKSNENFINLSLFEKAVPKQKSTNPTPRPSRTEEVGKEGEWNICYKDTRRMFS